MKHVTPHFVHETLRKLGPSLLKEPYKSKWTKQNPTYGYCYIVSEALYHYGKQGLRPCCLSLGGGCTHWFLKDGDTILDYTAAQFSFSLPYEQAVGKGFMKGSVKTHRGFLSKRGYAMAEALKLLRNQ